jgi:1-deoxy-D-xylulose-5-phosphate reductoisomerase
MKNLSILGSTGSIGRNTLRIAEKFPEKFVVKALAARQNTALLADQITKFQPELAVVYDEALARELKSALPADTGTDILHGPDGYHAAATTAAVDMVVTAVVGAAGLLPTLAAIEAGKDIALANKETLVMAGELVMAKARQKTVRILPVDSEHSAIFQCLNGNRRTDLDKILLTASGGPFLNSPADAFRTFSPNDALKHPNWQMGSKITIDSATLMNKGLEVIEAKWLFGVSLEQIEVVIHPQSIIHSMVAYRDGSIMAQLGIPDMKGAIAYALSYPERLPLGQPLPDFTANAALTFQSPDTQKFPCLKLAFQAAEAGETMPAVLNAANEIAVQAFLKQKLAFDRIAQVIAQTMEKHRITRGSGLEEIQAADSWARYMAQAVIENL